MISFGGGIEFVQCPFADIVEEKWGFRVPMDRPHENSGINPAHSCIMIKKDGVDIGFLGFVLETCDLGTEIVVSSIYILPEHSSGLIPLLDHIITEIGKLKGCISARFHTVRAGLVHQASALGWKASEIIVRKLL